MYNRNFVGNINKIIQNPFSLGSHIYKELP